MESGLRPFYPQHHHWKPANLHQRNYVGLGFEERCGIQRYVWRLLGASSLREFQTSLFLMALPSADSDLIWLRQYHYLPGTTQQNFFSNATTSHGTNYTFSTAPLLPVMRDHLFPFPLIVGDVASLNTRFAPLVGAAVPIQNIVYEMTPFE